MWGLQVRVLLWSHIQLKLVPMCVCVCNHVQFCNFHFQTVKSLPAIWETQVRSLSWEDPLEKKEWQPTPVFLPGKPRGQRNLAGYSPWGREQTDMTETNTHTQLPGSSAGGIFQGGKLQWVAISFSKGFSRPSDWTLVSCVPCIGRRILTRAISISQFVLASSDCHDSKTGAINSIIYFSLSWKLKS